MKNFTCFQCKFLFVLFRDSLWWSASAFANISGSTVMPSRQTDRSPTTSDSSLSAHSCKVCTTSETTYKKHTMVSATMASEIQTLPLMMPPNFTSVSGIMSLKKILTNNTVVFYTTFIVEKEVLFAPRKPPEITYWILTKRNIKVLL